MGFGNWVRAHSSELTVEGKESGFRLMGSWLEFMVWGVRWRVKGLRFGVKGQKFRVQGLGSRV